MQTTPTPQLPPNLTTIVSAFAKNEGAFTAAVTTTAFIAPPEALTERILNLLHRREFEVLFNWLDRRADTLVSTCRWLVFGPQLELSREVEVTIFEQLQFLIQLVREKPPTLARIIRQVITTSPLVQVVQDAEAQTATVPPS